MSSKSDEKQKVLLIARFSVQNFKMSVESWNSYIVHGGKNEKNSAIKLNHGSQN